MKKDKADKKERSIEKELEEMRALLQRTQADFVNHRRRVEEDKATFVKFACNDLVGQLLPVLDNFALAARHVPEGIQKDNWVTGIQAIEKQLEQILQANGLEKLETTKTQFDPSLHEAVGTMSDNKHKDNEIIREELAGYTLNGKLLRPAKVIVNKVYNESNNQKIK